MKKVILEMDSTYNDSFNVDDQNVLSYKDNSNTQYDFSSISGDLIDENDTFKIEWPTNLGDPNEEFWSDLL